MNGEFRGCELTAIVGTSGSGKSTLLDILSGFTKKGVEGAIKVNDRIADCVSFRKRSAYILQDQNFTLALTVFEAMKFSIKLKTGNSLTQLHQNIKIKSVLSALGLAEHSNVFIQNLSGGQQKRLSVALELVDDPLVLFLDEPTTGLDSTSSTQCIKLLKQLAEEGRTVVCTIHTPSALLLKMFDNVYALVDGNCIYQGSSQNLVPFLGELGLVCPESYNPADFLLEIASGEYGEQNSRLKEKIANGSNNDYRQVTKAAQRSKIEVELDSPPSDNGSTFLTQLAQLLRRNYLDMKRNNLLIIIRLMLHIVSGIAVGLIYFDIGNQAEQVINDFKLIFFVNTFIAYASFYSILVTCELNSVLFLPRFD